MVISLSRPTEEISSLLKQFLTPQPASETCPSQPTLGNLPS